MTPELRPLEMYLRQLWQQSFLQAGALNAEQLHGLTEHSSQYCASLYAALGPGTVPEMEHCFIHRQQTALVHLSDQLLTTIAPDHYAACLDPADLTGGGAIRHRLQVELAQLRNFLKEHFAHSWDPDVFIPLLEWQRAAAALKRHIDDAYRQFGDLGVDTGLLQLLHGHGSSFIQNRHPPTYRQLAYTRKLNKATGLLLAQQTRMANESLVLILTEQGFNCPHFARWYSAWLLDQCPVPANEAARMELVQQFELVYGQDDHPGIRLYPNRPPVNRMVLAELVKRITTGGLGASSAAGDRQPKIKCTLSVAQLACLLRLLTDLDIFSGVNVRDLTAICCRFISTTRCDHLSPESVRTKYYNLEKQPVDSIRELCLKMAHEARRHFP